MNITVPIYVEQKHLDGEQTQFRLRPLFFSSPEASDARLNRATSKLALELRKELGRLGKSMRHEELAAFNYCPSFQQFNVQCLVHLKQGSLSVQQLAVSFEHLDRRIAFFPALPDLWFEVQRGQDVQSRASQAMTEYCQAELRRDAESFESLKRLTNKEHCWITTIEIDLQPKQKIPEKSEVRLASLFASQPMDGESELDRVGRCLNWLYPDDLDRIICRESELEELNRILTSTDNRPVLIVGERQVGKTALIHEFVYQQVMKRKKVYQSRKNVWLLSPQRLVSGMVYVGQWEERLHAILKVAAKKNLTLYFDDLLGLFLAGISANNKLSMAEVLRPILEQRKVRVLGEITPEAFRVLQERDRGFADMFHILPLSQPDDGANLRIVIETARQLESHHRCRFALEVIPAVLDLQRRYVREAAFPGKAATFMRQLAIKYQKKEITRETVLKEFHQKSGMDINFLDTNSRLKHEEIVQALSSGVIGQDGAVETAASVVTIAKARLNDTGRPLAALLFVGPTGVGKTQCAKTLAAYLFGDEERLVRFDMNEFVSQHAVNRLVGTFNQPDGLLTTAIRQQPFSVVLLDEIEKADPSVFDLLLQVMGEGRLTDAHGRTVDFSNAIIILTSNLGVKDAMNRMGFLDEESDEQSIYTDASEKFFRPEFVNRLDRIVPFSRLKHDDVLQISRLLIEKVFHREGLIRRKCVLDIHDEALERVVSKGFHPQLGARAVKREIEKQLTKPAASQLVSLKPETPAIVSLFPQKDDISVYIQPLHHAERNGQVTLEDTQPEALIQKIEEAVSRLESEYAHLRPKKAIDTSEMESTHFAYFTLAEHADKIRQRVQRLRQQIVDHATRKRIPHLYQRQPRRPRFYRGWEWNVRAGEIWAVEDIHDYIRGVSAKSSPQGEKLEERILELAKDASLLEIMTHDARNPIAQNARVYMRSWGNDSEGRHLLQHSYATLFSNLGCTTTTPDLGDSAKESYLDIEGENAFSLASFEVGTHLFILKDAQFHPVQVEVLPHDDEDARDGVETHEQTHHKWLQQLYDGEATLAEDPFPVRPVIRIYDLTQNITMDLRTALLTTRPLKPEDLRLFMISSLPLSKELVC